MILSSEVDLLDELDELIIATMDITDEKGTGHIVFSRKFYRILVKIKPYANKKTDPFSGAVF